MRKRTDKEQAEYLSNKIKMKELNGMDSTDEICDALELILTHDGGTCDPDAYTKEFMRTHSIILPDDKDKRLEILMENIERILPGLKNDNPELNDIVRDAYITLDAVANEIWRYSDKETDDMEFPEDELMVQICNLLPDKGKPEESYYIAVRKHLFFLMKTLRTSIQEKSIEKMNAVGLRANLQSMQFEQLYRYELIKE